MNVLSPRFNLFIVVLLLTAHFGCASTPRTRFYSLNPLADSEKGKGPGDEPCVSIAIGPVKIPDYLDQSEIVTRITPNEVRMGEFDKWAEPLESNISWVLSKNLSYFLCTKVVSTYPSRGSIPLNYRVFVEITRMDGKLGENAQLEASWTVFDGKEKRKLLLMKQESYKEPTGGNDYEAFVSAQSRNLGRLSRDIAENIKTLPR